MEFGTMTIAIVGVSLLCTVVIVIAAVAIPFVMMRNNRKKAEALMATGKQGTATILSLEDTGMRINDDPRVRIMMDVQIEGYPPYRVQKTMTIPMIRMSQVQVGAVIPVLADPTQPDNPDKVGLLLR